MGRSDYRRYRVVDHHGSPDFYEPVTIVSQASLTVGRSTLALLKGPLALCVRQISLEPVCLFLGSSSSSLRLDALFALFGEHVIEV